MKNRRYKKNNRSIKQIRPGVWACKIASVKGHPDIPVIEVTGGDKAFNWLHAGPKKLTPPADIPKKLRQSILKRQRAVILRMELTKRRKARRQLKKDKANAATPR